MQLATFSNAVTNDADKDEYNQDTDSSSDDVFSSTSTTVNKGTLSL